MIITIICAVLIYLIILLANIFALAFMFYKGGRN